MELEEVEVEANEGLRMDCQCLYPFDLELEFDFELVVSKGVCNANAGPKLRLLVLLLGTNADTLSPLRTLIRTINVKDATCMEEDPIEDLHFDLDPP